MREYIHLRESIFKEIRFLFWVNLFLENPFQRIRSKESFTNVIFPKEIFPREIVPREIFLREIFTNFEENPFRENAFRENPFWDNPFQEIPFQENPHFLTHSVLNKFPILSL